VVDFEVEPAQQAIYIVITNTGSTVARNVTVEFEPELDSSFDRRGRPGLIRDLKPLREGIGDAPARKAGEGALRHLHVAGGGGFS
jgi:hypothetical protein